MKGWTTTKIWQIEGIFVVADAIEKAIALYRIYAGDPDCSISSVTRINNCPVGETVTIIEEK